VKGAQSADQTSGTYTAYGTALTVTFEQVTLTFVDNNQVSSACPLKYVATPASAISTGVVTLDADSRLMTISYSNNDKAGGPHDITITAKTPTNQVIASAVPANADYTYQLTIAANPCEPPATVVATSTAAQTFQ